MITVDKETRKKLESIQEQLLKMDGKQQKKFITEYLDKMDKLRKEKKNEN